MKVEVDTKGTDMLNDVFDLVLTSGVTRLRSKTKLSSLVMHEQELDSKKRQKYESIVEDMKCVSALWGYLK